ncbi:BamA/TamA family outer membrane protein [Candidatus Fermentibacterales bacterium]|nr:BamA/TamA family outer membrane protein [Candidatus Fermentibacterales bacterium]
MVMLRPMKGLGKLLLDSAKLCLPAVAMIAAGSADADYIEPTIDSIYVTDNLPVSRGDLLRGTGLREGIPQFQVTRRGVLDAVLDNLTSRGYLEADVNVIWPSWTDELGVAEIHVAPGRRSHYSGFVVSGNTVFEAAEIARMLGLSPGDLLTPAALADMESQLLDAYRQRGYVGAIIRVVVAPPDTAGLPDTLSEIDRAVECEVTEGQQVHLGAIRVEGLDTVRKKVVIREIPLARGDSLDMRILRESISDVYGLGLFQTVRIRYEGLEEGSDTVDVVVSVTERDYRTVDLGGGYLSPSAITGSAYWNHPNLFGNNQRLNIGGRITRYLSSGGGDEVVPQVSYEEPYFISTRWTARVTADYLYKELPGISERSYGIETTFSRRFGRSLEWEVGYRVERSRYAEEAEESDWATSAIVSTSLVHDTRNSPFSPSRGHRLSGGVDAAGLLVGGRQYYRLTAEVRVFKAVKRDFILAWRLGAGRVEPYGGDEIVEPDDRFFLGGGTTVRGYGFNDLGPEDEQGNSLGGRVMLLGNIETRLRVIGSLGFVLFADTGGLWDSLSDVSLDNMGFGTGLGLRYETPFGPLRIDYGFAPTWREGFRRGRVYVALGHAF